MLTSRPEIFKKLQQPLDMIIIGGGITGAGIFLEATLLGLKVALFEQHDFASGTSSRSSKLVHGGLRYLQQWNFKLTYEAVQEREWMLTQLPGLVEPLPFIFPIYKGRKPDRLLVKAGLFLYDLFANKDYHRHLSFNQLRLRAPALAEKNLQGGYVYLDAKTDDARLTWRIIAQGIEHGGIALNYANVSEIKKDETGKIQGVCIQDGLSAHTQILKSTVVINATGFLAHQFNANVPESFHLRPLRGSHLILPAWRLPVSHAIAAAHPQDGRLVFVIPWEGATLVGTTDLDHKQNAKEEPYCTEAEVKYLLTHLQFLFPSLDLESCDILSTFAGVRPIVSSGKKANPSAESRDHVIVDNQGFMTVTGGKLTTWRLIARDTLQKARVYLPVPPTRLADDVYFPKTPENNTTERLFGRYGQHASTILGSPNHPTPSHSCIPGTPMLWAELSWIAEQEMVVHLDDLLLRRTRLGLLLPEGGKALFPHLKKITAVLGWSEQQWQDEETRYCALWQKACKAHG